MPISSIGAGDLDKVWEIKTLKRKEREDEARRLLEMAAKQVQPIMRKRKWQVKLLSEFWSVFFVSLTSPRIWLRFCWKRKITTASALCEKLYSVFADFLEYTLIFVR